MNVLIGGIGNILLGDDGLGPYLARVLEASFDFAEGVEVADLGTPALELIDAVSGRDAVILIDSLQVDAAPGTVRLYRKEDLLQFRPTVRMDPHSPALIEAILSAEFLGAGPGNVLLVGIVGQTYEPGCALSEPVQSALGTAIAEILRELDRLHVSYRQKEHWQNPQIWWNHVEYQVPSE